MKRAYITHVTRDYLDVAVNLAKSLSLFSEIPLLVYCVNLENEDYIKFKDIRNTHLRNIEFELEEKNSDDLMSTQSGNFYVNRNSIRIYKILCIKTIAMQMAIEEGWSEVCYLDSDCIATPNIDEIFNWSNEITNYPLATEGIHQYVMFWENNIEYGNPFSGGSWPIPDNKLALEWPLMNFLGMSEDQRGTYRTTNVLLMNSNCLEFVKTWRELCFILPKLVNVRRWAGFHEETIYNVLNWRETNKGLPLCYINIGEGLETVKHFYSEEAKEGSLRWSETDTSQNFYRIPDDKKYVKVLHGEKRSSEVDKILNFFKNEKIDLSLLVHTCDNYEKFWFGMFYTLDFYWKYDDVQVYFANEEKPISQISFNCKGIEYKPDSRIKQILTGKSEDKNGFSTRFIQAVSQVPTKYVLYIQEDMWLKRSIETKVLKDIIKFMDDNNATSVRLHAKLFYYESYKLEPTDFIIDGNRMYKNLGGHILSHNATIWRKDYILKHQRNGEDPWVNEEQGTIRMMQENEGNYHYNIHWYCQPGIADKGEFSPEALVYAHIVDEMKSIDLKKNN